MTDTSAGARILDRKLKQGSAALVMLAILVHAIECLTGGEHA